MTSTQSPNEETNKWGSLANKFVFKAETILVNT